MCLGRQKHVAMKIFSEYIFYFILIDYPLCSEKYICTEEAKSECPLNGLRRLRAGPRLLLTRF